MYDCEYPTDWKSCKRSNATQHVSENESEMKTQKRRSSKNDEKRLKRQKTMHPKDEMEQVNPSSPPLSPLPVSLTPDDSKTLGSPNHLGNIAQFSRSHVTTSTLEACSGDPSSFHIDFAVSKIVPSSNTKIKQLILKQFRSILSKKTCAVPHVISPFNANDFQQEETSYTHENKKHFNMQLDTENLLSKLPYKKMLTDMFGGNLRGQLTMTNIPYVSRAYEEAFMHEPINASERECAKGKLCECMFIDKLHPFVCVEFLLPGEKPSRTPNMCVLCYRAITQQLYYDVIFDKCEFPGTIQKFGNIHSESGEYALEAMLIAAPSAPVHIMPLPIVSHQRNRYQVYSVSGGVKRLRQTNVYFQHTPSCNLELGP
jgi:hypothetical protein